MKQCETCSKELRKQKRFCSRVCKGISMSKNTGQKATHWRGGKNKCIDCTKLLSVWKQAKRCRQCDCKYRISIGTFVPFRGSGAGESNPAWRGGISTENHRIRNSMKMKNWRKEVFERDNYTCQICFARGGELNADHIKPFAFFPELRFELSNGRTLCVQCHRKTDTFGYLGIIHKRAGTAFLTIV